MMNALTTDVRTETLRSELLKIAEKFDGCLLPARIVEAAENPASPLHDEFDWDDSTAGQKFRLAQASMLVRRIKLSIVTVDRDHTPTQVTVRQFESRPSKRNPDGGYETIDDIMSDEAKRTELLERVMNDLKAYRKRYGRLTSLSKVWAAIDKL